MEFETEIVQEKQKALLISKTDYSFIDFLKSHLKKFSVEQYFSSQVPKQFKEFDYLFLIDSHVNLSKIEENSDKKFIFIFFHNKTPSYLLHSILNNLKIIEVDITNLDELNIDRILWFAFSDTKEILLRLNKYDKKKPFFHQEKEFQINKYLTRKISLIAFLAVFVVTQVIFIPFLLLSTFYSYQSYISLKKEDYQNLENNISSSKNLYDISQKLYSLSRPTYRLLGASLLPDNLMEINMRGTQTIEETNSLRINYKEIQRLLFAKNKTEVEIDDLKLRFQELKNSLNIVSENVNTIIQKNDLPFKFTKSINSNLLEASELLDKSKKLFAYFETILSKQTSSKFLIFFANNMELRPGGGFLGSFAILDMKNYEISEIKVYDVYDADGQLTTHIDPPKPIEQYLNIPHWFLRDSNFSPDFLENYEKAIFFLEKEIGVSDFDGGLLLTTTAVENILTAFDNIYLPDFKENINSKNFYLKTQLYSEKNFFPGSIQKQVFLSSVTQQLLLNLENMSLTKFLTSVKKSLDEKQIVVYLNDQSIQTLFSSSFWSGRVIEPKCLANSETCLVDYLFPYDANVGANKANYFINRSQYLKTNIDAQGTINHLFSIQYQNNSPSEIFPTGVYRNYFQILIPINSDIKQITKDGVEVEEIDQKDGIFKQVGFYFEVPPKKTVEIKINYQLKEKITTGSHIYQLVVQKQIGASNSDLVLDFNLNRNISIINQNFSPLVKDQQIIYNTSLTTDKLFSIELVKN